MDDLQEMKQLIEQMRKRLHDSLHGRCFTDPKSFKGQSSNE
ncbi:MAG: hypothetical protein K0Q77_813 [Anaerosporomusa subterranea]|nr:hypothetical protein [Anaerosporomusa subterranea]